MVVVLTLRVSTPIVAVVVISVISAIIVASPSVIVAIVFSTSALISGVYTKMSVVQHAETLSMVDATTVITG